SYESIGVLLAGISHEIFNPLSGIHGPLDNLENLLIKYNLSDNPKVKKYYNVMRFNLKKVENIIKNMKLLFSKGNLIYSEINSNRIIKEVIQEVCENNLFNKSINISFTRQDKIYFTGNYTAMTQILTNLIRNSIDAIGDSSGEILVSSVINKQSRQIIIKDNGCGIPEETQQNIFQPFYTTKETGKGTGLGLYLSKFLLLKMGYDLRVDSEKGKYTEFRIILNKSID
ncbi:MAG: HAMP domain-containing histidine kinase, partial [Spirochaetes bacterium]|nr:HAMP domain-containing histidine kinase [Spirochaetota bacterium]